VLPDWDWGRNPCYNVVGTSPLALSVRGDFTPGGTVARAAANKLQYHRNHLSRNPPRVLFRPFAIDTFGGLHEDAVEMLQRLQGVVNQAALAHEDIAWCSSGLRMTLCGRVRRVGFTIARAVGRQLATHLPGWAPSGLGGLCWSPRGGGFVGVFRGLRGGFVPTNLCWCPPANSSFPYSHQAVDKMWNVIRGCHGLTRQT
jgi:hypothetical protein